MLENNNVLDLTLIQGGELLQNKQALIAQGGNSNALLQSTGFSSSIKEGFPSKNTISNGSCIAKNPQLLGADVGCKHLATQELCVVSPSCKWDSLNMTLDTLEKKFNYALAEYEKNYAILIKELKHNSKNNDLLHKYGGKNIAFGNNYYYVNKYGVYREYDPASISENNGKASLRCQEAGKFGKSIPASDFDKLIPAPSANIGEIPKKISSPDYPCGFAGQNIVTADGKMAFVDIDGIKHIYKKGPQNNHMLHSSCKKLPATTISDNEFNAIPKSRHDYGLQSVCNPLDVSTNVLSKLYSLNATLSSLAKELVADTSKLYVTDNDLKAKQAALIATMLKNIRSLESDKKQIASTLHSSQNVPQSHGDNSATLKGIRETSEFKLSSIYLTYLFWLTMAVGLSLFTYYNYASDTPSSFILIIVLILILIMLYKLWTYLHYKFF